MVDHEPSAMLPRPRINRVGPCRIIMSSRHLGTVGVYIRKPCHSHSQATEKIADQK